MRICVMYDCLFPWTVGGGERWFRAVAERLAADGHQVTYLTRTQWPRGEEPQLPGIRVIGIGRRHLELYDGEVRKPWPPLRFGIGVFWHLLRHGREYDVIHTASFPFFSLLAAGLVRPIGRYRIVCDWFEVWSREYWRGYIGGLAGRIGWLVQGACTRVPQVPQAISQLSADRVHALNPKLRPHVLTGLYDGALDRPTVTDPPADPLVVYAGRHTQEKRVPELVSALAEAHRQRPNMRAILFGDGPHRARVLAEIQRLGLSDVVQAPGFVDQTELDAVLAGASCLVQPSEREGYGLVVVESATRGVPVVVVAGEDNAMTELVEPGINGQVASSIEPAELAGAILGVIDAGRPLRESTAQWLTANAQRLSLQHTLTGVERRYERALSGPAAEDAA